MTTAQVARAAEALNWPTEGEFAHLVWSRLSSMSTDYCSRALAYREIGYIPFAAYISK